MKRRRVLYRPPMTCPALLKTLLLGLALTVFSGCPKVPLTGRHSLILVPESQEMALGVQSFDEILKKSKLSGDAAATAMLERVGKRIAAVSGRPDYAWEFKLLDDPKTVNAFCLPGGKVAFYTGILPITQSEAGIAVVMGHEVGHALAKHGAERMSQQILLSVGEVSLALALQKKPAETRALYGAAYGVGAGVGVILPFGRFQESEADHIGLLLMAKAGYDPREAVNFWKRMQAKSGGKAPPEFLSTHPADEKRIKQIEDWMPEALKYYEESKTAKP